MKKLLILSFLLLGLLSCGNQREPSVIVRGAFVNVTVNGYTIETSKEFTYYGLDSTTLVIKSAPCDTSVTYFISADSVYVFDVNNKSTEVFPKQGK